MFAPDPRFAVVDRMTGPEFEEALVELFEGLGYNNVERIGGFDKGADLVVEIDGERTAVQAKRYSGGVRIGAVRQVLDGRGRYGCTKALVVTNSYFTPPAIECATDNEIELWDRRTLAQWLEGPAPVVDTSRCAHCGSEVSHGVTDFCLDKPYLYGGNVYCMAHQPRKRRAK